MLFNFICAMSILTVLSGVPIEKTVSDNDLKVVDSVNIDDEVVNQIDEPILFKSVAVPGAYYNDDYVGWKFRMYRFSDTDQIWVLIFPSYGNWYNTTFYPSPRRIEVQLRDMNYSDFAVDFDGDVQTYTYGSYPTYYQIVNQNYPNSGSLIQVTYGTVQAESDAPSSGGDSIDYTDILNSIDTKLDFLNSIFYFSGSIDEMGDAFKIAVILIFLLVLNLIVKIISWRW